GGDRGRPGLAVTKHEKRRIVNRVPTVLYAINQGGQPDERTPSQPLFKFWRHRLVETYSRGFDRSPWERPAGSRAAIVARLTVYGNSDGSRAPRPSAVASSES